MMFCSTKNLFLIYVSVVDIGAAILQKLAARIKVLVSPEGERSATFNDGFSFNAMSGDNEELL